MEFDHAFIAAAPGAPEADALIDFGLSEGEPARHPGQGTANRRFFFRNAYLELLYLVDADEARSGVTTPTRLFDRLTLPRGGASPFGFAFRPETGGAAAPPFPSWGYRPAYLASGAEIAMGEAPVAEPLWFFLPFAKRPDAASRNRRPPLDHACGFGEITAIELTVPAGVGGSAPAKAAQRTGDFRITEGASPLLSIGFDGVRRGGLHDFRPRLPLLFRW